MAIQSYKDLIAWQKAMALVRMVYAVTKLWPKEETYGLSQQARRAAVSIPSNIAEGQGRHSSNEFRQHLRIAYGSLMELETQILIASGLEYQTEEQTRELLETAAQVGRLINALTNSLPAHRPQLRGGPLTTDH